MSRFGNTQNRVPRKLNTALIYLAYLNVSILLLGFMSFRPVADDYCFAKQTLNEGIFSTIAFYVTNWTPLYTSYFLQIFPTGIVDSRHTLMFTQILVMLLMILYANYILKFQTRECFKNTQVVFPLATGVLVFVGLSFSPGAALFFLIGWPGTFLVHTLPFCLLLLLILTIESKHNRKVLFSSVLLVTLAGTGTLAVLFCAIILVFLSTYSWLNGSFFEFKVYFLNGISIFLIQIILYLMPGNSTRFQNNELGVKSLINLMKSEESLVRVLYLVKWHISNSISLVAFSLTLMIGICIHALLKSSKKSYLLLSITLLFLYLVFIFITAIVETLTYDAIWHSIFPMIFLYLSALIFGSYIGSVFSSFFKNLESLFPSVMIIAHVFLLLVVYQYALPQFERSLNWDDRLIEQKWTSIPPRDFNGNQLLADTEQTWVLECYSSSQ
jgi:hypothetical protein